MGNKLQTKKSKKPSRKSLTNKLDKLVSEVVRLKGKCQRCGKRETLQACHIFSRTYRSVRWYLKNLLCLCAGCHFWAHKNPILFAEFVQSLYTKEGYEELKRLAQVTKRWQVWELQELVKKFQQML